MKTMPRRVRAAALVLPLAMAGASVASTGCDLAMHHYSEKQTAEWRKTYDLKPGGRIEIRNVNGKIEVQPAAGNSVEVVAEKSAAGASVDAAKEALAGIQIQDTASPDEIRIVTKVSRTGGGFFGGGNQVVHYTVKVPLSAEAIFSTVNGGVEISGLKGRVTAEATNGGVKARDISGPIDASTTNGGVDVELAEVADSGVKLGCVNGGIELKLPSTAKANISARVTNGGINASGLPIETVGESSKRRLEGRLNGGGPQIELSGTNGGIRIASR
jgi:bifunctional DNA-binding transcriptional regulator/antitoxin component of YhaV-PrlF toxin-antitoxin module